MPLTTGVKMTHGGKIVSIVVFEKIVGQCAAGASPLIIHELSFTERSEPRETKPKRNPIRNVQLPCVPTSGIASNLLRCLSYSRTGSFRHRTSFSVHAAVTRTLKVLAMYVIAHSFQDGGWFGFSFIAAGGSPFATGSMFSHLRMIHLL